MITELQKKTAEGLLSIGAIFLRPDEPFTWTSGIKSPIYCDHRLTLSDVAVREDVEAGLAELVRENYPDAEVLMGTSTGGIAHAAMAATLLRLPCGYVRPSAKDHGRGKRIEGKMAPGARVVVVEDLISTGGSVLEVVDTLREEGGEVLGIVSIFTYDMAKGTACLAQAGVKNVSLCNLDALLEVAAKTGYIKESDVSDITAFRNAPSEWRCNKQ